MAPATFPIALSHIVGDAVGCRHITLRGVLQALCIGRRTDSVAPSTLCLALKLHHAHHLPTLTVPVFGIGENFVLACHQGPHHRREQFDRLLCHHLSRHVDELHLDHLAELALEMRHVMVFLTAGIHGGLFHTVAHPHDILCLPVQATVAVFIYHFKAQLLQRAYDVLQQVGLAYPYRPHHGESDTCLHATVEAPLAERVVKR